MIKDRQKLDDYVRKHIKQLSRKATAEVTQTLVKDKGFPMSLASDIFCLRKDPAELSAFELFCVTGVIAESKLNEYYSAIEIQRYGKEKYYVEQLKFPLEFNMTQVSYDQWIGASTAKELMKLREHQLINYNKNTQRVMTRIIRGESVDYKISINYNAVQEIKQSLKDGTFIPNAITLNINDDQDCLYHYDNGKLTVGKLDAFDIVDGFHRYLAFAEMYDEDNSWDYPIELRIIAFSESKASHMVYQEYQHTPMSKAAINSLNQNSYTNMVCKRLNEDTSCNLSGQIFNYGYVDSAVLSSALDITNIKTKKEMIGLCSELKKYINQITEKDTHYLDHRWTEAQIYMMVYGFFNKKTIVKTVKAMSAIENANQKEHRAKIVRDKKFTPIVKQHIEEVFSHV